MKSNQEPIMNTEEMKIKLLKIINVLLVTCHFHHKYDQCACGTREICERNPTVLTEYKHVSTYTHTHTNTHIHTHTYIYKYIYIYI